MTESDPGTAAEAVQRAAEGVVSGNIALLMATITPDAMTQLMQLGTQAGGLSPTTMPDIQGYELGPESVEGEDHLFDVSFRSSAGSVTIGTRWRLVLGQWKIASINLVSAEPAGSAS